MIGINSVEIILCFTMLILMIKTKERTMERPRLGILIEDGHLYEQLENGVERTISYGHYASPANEGAITMLKAFEQQNQKEPKIDVRIKPRTKDHASDDFKLVVNYQVELSQKELERMSSFIPQTPRGGSHVTVDVQKSSPVF